MFVDLFIFYMAVGLVTNWAVALYCLFTGEFDEMEVDPMNFFLTIPIWPLTIWNVITSFTNKE